MSDRVELICKDCGEKRTITKGDYTYRINNGKSVDLCRKCNLKKSKWRGHSW